MSVGPDRSGIDHGRHVPVVVSGARFVRNLPPASAVAASEDHHGEHAPGEERQAGRLDQDRTGVVVLAQEHELFVEARQAPQRCGGGQHETGGPVPVAVLDEDQHAEDDEAVECLDERYRDPVTDLAGVLEAVPRRGLFSSAVHHELRPEQATHTPGGHEHRRDEVQELHGGHLGAPASGEEGTDRDREEESAERRQAPVPHRQDLPRIGGVVRPVGHDVHEPGADDGGHHDPHEDARKPLPRIAALAKTALHVAVSEPERDGQADAVGMDQKWPDVKGHGYGLHVGDVLERPWEVPKAYRRHRVARRRGPGVPVTSPAWSAGDVRRQGAFDGRAG